MAEKFLWGAASASAQIEGGFDEDGRTESCWDVFGKEPNRIYEGQTCSVACDSYHKYKEDIKLLKELGVKSYRFSLSWNRILPNDNEIVNPKGIEFYNNVINELLANGIEPLVTIFHWDMPKYVCDNGGWLDRKVVTYFERYTKVVVEAFSDRVKKFITINEPQNCLCGAGGTEIRQYSPKESLQMIHNLLLCNGVMTKIIRDHGCQAGMAMAFFPHAPATKSKEDLDASYEASFDVSEGNVWNTSPYLDPVILGKYPDKYYKVNKKEDLPDINEDDMKIINCGMDFIGLNIYSCSLVKHSDEEKGYEDVKFPRGTPVTLMKWFVWPDCMYYGPLHIYRRYKLPIYLTENGMSTTDLKEEDNKIHDPARSYYIKKHIERLLDAKKDGVDIRGYFYWSILDNFEWLQGYSQRFGITYVDYSDCSRYKKDSFYTYQKIIKKNKNL